MAITYGIGTAQDYATISAWEAAQTDLPDDQILEYRTAESDNAYCSMNFANTGDFGLTITVAPGLRWTENVLASGWLAGKELGAWHGTNVFRFGGLFSLEKCLIEYLEFGTSPSGGGHIDYNACNAIIRRCWFHDCIQNTASGTQHYEDCFFTDIRDPATNVFWSVSNSTHYVWRNCTLDPVNDTVTANTMLSRAGSGTFYTYGCLIISRNGVLYGNTSGQSDNVYANPGGLDYGDTDPAQPPGDNMLYHEDANAWLLSAAVASWDGRIAPAKTLAHEIPDFEGAEVDAFGTVRASDYHTPGAHQPGTSTIGPAQDYATFNAWEAAQAVDPDGPRIAVYNAVMEDNSWAALNFSNVNLQQIVVTVNPGFRWTEFAAQGNLYRQKELGVFHTSEIRPQQGASVPIIIEYLETASPNTTRFYQPSSGIIKYRHMWLRDTLNGTSLAGVNNTIEFSNCVLEQNIAGDQEIMGGSNANVKYYNCDFVLFSGFTGGFILEHYGGNHECYGCRIWMMAGVQFSNTLSDISRIGKDNLIIDMDGTVQQSQWPDHWENSKVRPLLSMVQNPIRYEQDFRHLYDRDLPNGLIEGSAFDGDLSEWDTAANVTLADADGFISQGVNAVVSAVPEISRVTTLPAGVNVFGMLFRLNAGFEDPGNVTSMGRLYNGVTPTTDIIELRNNASVKEVRIRDLFGTYDTAWAPIDWGEWYFVRVRYVKELVGSFDAYLQKVSDLTVLLDETNVGDYSTLIIDKLAPVDVSAVTAIGDGNFSIDHFMVVSQLFGFPDGSTPPYGTNAKNVIATDDYSAFNGGVDIIGVPRSNGQWDDPGAFQGSDGPPPYAPLQHVLQTGLYIGAN